MNNYQWVIDNYQNRLQIQSPPARTFERLRNIIIVVFASCSLFIVIH